MLWKTNHLISSFQTLPFSSTWTKYYGILPHHNQSNLPLLDPTHVVVRQDSMGSCVLWTFWFFYELSGVSEDFIDHLVIYQSYKISKDNFRQHFVYCLTIALFGGQRWCGDKATDNALVRKTMLVGVKLCSNGYNETLSCPYYTQLGLTIHKFLNRHSAQADNFKHYALLMSSNEGKTCHQQCYFLSCGISNHCL